MIYLGRLTTTTTFEPTKITKIVNERHKTAINVIRIHQ